MHTGYGVADFAGQEEKPPGDAIDRAQRLCAACGVNPEEEALARRATIFLRGPGSEVLPRLVEAVRAHREG